MQQVTKELLDKIKEETGAISIVLILADSRIPCPDTLSGEECAHPHEVGVGMDGFSIGAAIGILMEGPNK